MKTGIALAIVALSFGLTVTQAYAESEAVGTPFPAHETMADASSASAPDVGSEATTQTATSLPQHPSLIAVAHSRVHSL